MILCDFDTAMDSGFIDRALLHDCFDCRLEIKFSTLKIGLASSTALNAAEFISKTNIYLTLKNFCVETISRLPASRSYSISKSVSESFFIGQKIEPVENHVKMYSYNHHGKKLKLFAKRTTSC